MTSKEQAGWPVPLRERDQGLGNVVREYAHSTEATGDEPAAYQRVLKRLARRPRRAPWLMVGFGMGAAAALAAIVVLSRGAKTPSREAVTVVPTLPEPPRPPAAIPAPPARTPPVAAIRLSTVASILPAGKVELSDQASAMVSVDAVASGLTRAGYTEIALGKGSIELHVLPRAPGHGFGVSAGSYRFMVVGTAFTVSRSEARLELSVSEGEVAVWRRSDRLTTVGAGGKWSVPLAPAAPARATRVQTKPSSTVALREPVRPATPAWASSPSPAASGAAAETPVAPPPVAPASPNPEPASHPAAVARRDCGAIAGRNPREAMGCYQQQVAQGGLAGEAAQYEIARLLRDTFHDPARALAAFREQRVRFPRGALAIEADLSIIELLPRLERHAEALTESERYLKEHPSAERRGEIHLLRGNIFREAMRDFAHAEREYALGSETRGRAGDENRFLRAVCLEALGRAKEARRAYEAYLSQRNAAHAEEARKRLEHLAP
jgi:hypothetical protein